MLIFKEVAHRSVITLPAKFNKGIDLIVAAAEYVYGPQCYSDAAIYIEDIAGFYEWRSAQVEGFAGHVGVQPTLVDWKFLTYNTIQLYYAVSERAHHET